MMLPKRMAVYPGISADEIMALRAHIDEAVTDPDYSVVISYECTWDEEWEDFASRLARALSR
jgi:hypothetical protein